MKRFAAFLLALASFFARVQVFAVHATPGEAQPLAADTDAIASIENADDRAYFIVTPAITARYFFTSHAEYDTYAYLYNAAMQALAFDDDGLDGSNFCVEYVLQAGESYYFSVSFYEASRTGSFPVRLRAQGEPLISIGLNQSAVALTKGGEAALTVSYYPADTTDDKSVTWQSSNPTVAAVANGVVTAVNAGTAIITASVGGKAVCCTVTVALPFVAVSGISGVPTAVKAGQSLTLKGTVAPANATNKTVTWRIKSAGETGAVISGATLKTKAAGSVVVTGTVKNGKTASANYTKDFTIQVQAVPTAVALNKTALTLGVKESITPSVTLAPSGVKTVCSWSSSNTAVAKVDKATGKITAVKAGTATVTVTTENNLKKSVAVTVKVAPSAVALNKTVLTLGKGETFKLVATLNSGAASSKMSWSSSNTKVVAVDVSGKLTAKAAGAATVTVTTFNGRKKSCKVMVEAAPTAVSLSKTALTLGKGETFKLAVTLNAGAASYKMSWSSSNTKAVTVDASGKLTAKAAGAATVTATAFNGQKKSCKVTVKAAPSAVTLSKSSLVLTKGKTAVLKATLNPAGAASYQNTWKSGNPKVAKVDANGKVTAVGKGSANITFTTYNGKTKSCKVTVK